MRCRAASEIYFSRSLERTESFESIIKSHEARHHAIQRLRVSPAIKTLKIPEILPDHGFKSHILSAYLNENPDCTTLSNRGREALRGQRSRNICYENIYTCIKHNIHAYGIFQQLFETKVGRENYRE